MHIIAHIIYIYHHHHRYRQWCLFFKNAKFWHISANCFWPFCCKYTHFSVPFLNGAVVPKNDENEIWGMGTLQLHRDHISKVFLKICSRCSQYPMCTMSTISNIHNIHNIQCTISNISTISNVHALRNEEGSASEFAHCQSVVISYCVNSSHL